MKGLKKLLPIGVAVALLVSLLVPMTVLATGDTASGTLNATNLTPDVTAVEVYSDESCTTTAASMTPGTTYYAKVSVSDPNTLADLATVKVTFKHFAAEAATEGDPTSDTADTRTVVHLTCTVGGTPTWAVNPEADATHTWAIVTESCDQPDLAGTSGDWIFAFTPGKVATESVGGVVANAGWGVYAKATDAAPLSDGMWWAGAEDAVKKGMDWSGELAIDLGTVAFGDIAPGVSDLASPNFVLTNIANGAYQIQLKSSAIWTCESPEASLTLVESQTPGAAQLALEADDDASIDDAQLVTDGYVPYTGHSADSGPTVEAGAIVTTNTLWLSLGATGIPVGLYTGTIYYQVIND